MKKMTYSLRTKLSLSYVLVALVSIALLSFLTNFFMDRQFKDYIIREQDRKNTEIVTLVTQQYKGVGSWDEKTIENIGINALEQGMIVKVTDASGTTIWDAKVHNNGMCQQMIAHMASNMRSRYPNWNGEYVENPYPVMNNFTEVGKVQIGYYGPFYFTDSDLAFIGTLNRILVLVGLVSLLIALSTGILMAKRLSTPISRVIRTAQKISEGLFDDRVQERSNTREIRQLTGTINELAGTLEKQESLRKQLTADVAHELRTPLATLQSHLEAMIDGIWQPEPERLKSCHEEVIRINRLVGDLARLAQYENENLLLSKTEFDLSDLIRQLLTNFEIEFINKNICVAFQGGETRILADRDKISQILINLVSNALKFTPAGGTVEICVHPMEDTVQLMVRDNGTGIPPEDLPHIFERFYRADKSRNRMTGGSGIGLTIVHSLVEAHGGTIDVVSQVGKGSEFIVSLPRILKNS